MRSIGIIPARMGSKRLPGKPLMEINHKPMLYWVYEAAVASDLHDVCVATPSKSIYKYCVARNIPCFMTGCHHKTGTDRVYEVFSNHYQDADLIFNIQCDEPLLQPYMINKMIDASIENESHVETLGMIMKSRYTEMFKKDIVKVVTDRHGFAIKFARRMYPWEQFGRKHYPRQHVGIYAFQNEVLEKFVKLPQTKSEIDHSLEQLRLMENNYNIHVTICDKYMIGVDTQEDIDTINSLINKGVIRGFC